MKTYSIAIDGPSASGKSTAAKLVAKKLNFLYIDTGAMYRALTLLMIDKGLDCKSRKDATIALTDCDIKENREGQIFLNGIDVTSRVRMPDVTSLVSFACAHLEVREHMVKLQQKMAGNENVIMDGRDIGTVVLKNATLKIYQIASSYARAERRQKEFNEKGVNNLSIEEIQKDIERRDYLDSNRENSPLRKADDAIELDTSNLSIDEEVNAIIDLFRKKIGEEEWNNLV